MAGRKINGAVKLALEFGPLLIFFVAYSLFKDRVFTVGATEYDGFIVVTAAFVPLMIASTGALWALTGHLSRMQAVTLVLVVVFAGLSVWLNDERFFKMKPTMIYLLFAGILGFGLLRGRSYLKLVMEDMMPLDPAGWKILTRRLAAFFAALAVANELLWRTQSTETWVSFKTFGLPLAMFVFFMAQSRLLQRHAVEKKD